jgi:hypothetical protein
MISALEHRAPSQQLAFAAAGATAKEQKVQGTWCSECALIYQLLRHRPLAITQPLSTEQLVPHDGAQAREPTNQGKPTCPQYHKLDPYTSCCAIMLPPLCSPPKHAIMPVMLPPPHYAEIYASLGRNAQETSELHLQCIICIGALC